MMSESPADTPEADPVGDRDGTEEWLAREVPGIVSGLESSGLISGTTAAAARRHLDDGRCSQALAIVLAEAER